MAAINVAGSLDTILGEVEGFDKHGPTMTLFGVPLPHFCLREFFSSSVLPVAKTLLIAGVTGAGKTTLGLEFGRIMHEQSKGFLFMNHTEGKYPDTLVPAVLGLGHEKFYRKQTEDETVQEWQARMMGLYRDSLGNVKHPAHRVPCVTLLDSIDGREGGDRHKNTVKDGHSTRNYSESARLLKEWFPSFTTRVARSSALPIFISHLKGTDLDRYTTGGVTKDFFAAYNIYMTYASTKTEPTKEFETTFNMKLIKNSFGPSGAYLKAFRKGTFPGGVPKIEFLWGKTTTIRIEQLMSPAQKGNLPPTHPLRQGLLKEFKRSNRGKYGIGYAHPMVAGGEVFNDEDFGNMIESSGQFVADLNAAFNITERPSIEEHWKAVDAELRTNTKAKRAKKKREKAPKPGDKK
jgi:hypothetical protein